MIRTTDPEKMKKEINALRPTGGGDIPEMCLSGLQVERTRPTAGSQGHLVGSTFYVRRSLQLALTGAPASSNIYVFTDAPAKDTYLKDTIVALIRSTKSTVGDV